ncbi:Tol-Pal system beta propeller repeat protein TolB [Cellvibrio sp.]|uniref:Tol-Pal system beta propeller repeat protein TolB n=1 Tax=Cellvibrio sp. TaxID=1965322 RepID=UPI0039648391
MKRIVLFCMVLLSGYANAQLTNITISKGIDNPTRIAVDDFSGPKLAEDIPAIIRNDLNFSGQFESIDPNQLITHPRSESEISYRDFKAIKAEYLLIGSVTEQGGRYTASYELFDVVQQKRVFIKMSVDGAESQLRDMAHRISDKVYETITGIRGIFSTKIIYVEAFSKPNKSRLMLSDVDGARSRVLFESKQPIMSPVWSPDGTRVAYVSFETDRPAIYVQTLSTGRKEQITNFKGLNGAPAWSPDGQKLAMVLSKDDNPEIYTVDLATRAFTRITNQFAIDTEPSWTIDGTGIFFTSDRGVKPQIYKVTLATGVTERVTFDGDYNARGRVSPDGKSLVMVNKRPGGSYQIAAQDLKTGNLRILTETNYDESPTIAPNGAMLMYATSVGGKGILGAVSLDARTKVRLPSKLGDVREPAWSPFF